eukprot:10371152-Lingulodinium_polyedra.AAC.1
MGGAVAHTASQAFDVVGSELVLAVRCDLPVFHQEYQAALVRVAAVFGGVTSVRDNQDAKGRRELGEVQAHQRGIPLATCKQTVGSPELNGRSAIVEALQLDKFAEKINARLAIIQHAAKKATIGRGHAR